MKKNFLLRIGLALGAPMMLQTSACSLEPEDFGFREMSRAQFGLEEEHSSGGLSGHLERTHKWEACIDLTEEQNKSLAALRQSMLEDVLPVKEELREIRDNMHALWSAPRPDKDAIMATHAAMEAPVRQLVRTLIAYGVEGLARLTPEQKQELFACLGECGARSETARWEKEDWTWRVDGTCRRGEGQHGGFGGVDHGARDGLDLTPVQMVLALSRLWELRSNVSPELEQLDASSVEMCHLWRVETPDPEDLGAAFEQMLPPLQELLEAFVDFRIEFAAILDEEKREKLAEQMSDRRRHMEEIQ